MDWIHSLFVLLAISVIKCERMDILAFDYYRHFGQYLYLGQCPDRTHQNKAGAQEIRRCSVRQTGTTAFSPSPIKQSQVTQIDSPDELWQNIGLCKGMAVSYFGLIDGDHDCISVEIAKQIPQDDHTFTKGLFEYHRDGFSVLRSNSRKTNDVTNNVVHVRDISYGAIDMILVVMTFNDSSTRNRVSGMKLKGSLSKQFRNLYRQPGLNMVKIIRLSTAQNLYEVKAFSKATFHLAANYIRSQERDIRTAAVRQTKTANDNAHFKYGIGRGSSPKDTMWKDVTATEVKLHTEIVKFKDIFKKVCKHNFSDKFFEQKCSRFEKVVSKLQKAVHKKLHRGRARWYKLSQGGRVYLSRAGDRLLRNVERVKVALKGVDRRTSYLKVKAQQRVAREVSAKERERKREVRRLRCEAMSRKAEEKRKVNEEKEKRRRLRKLKRKEKLRLRAEQRGEQPEHVDQGEQIQTSDSNQELEDHPKFNIKTLESNKGNNSSVHRRMKCVLFAERNH